MSSTWAAQHIELVITLLGGVFAVGVLLVQMGRNTQRVVSRIDSLERRVQTVEKEQDVGRESRGKLHERVDEVRERVVKVETRQEATR